MSQRGFISPSKAIFRILRAHSYYLIFPLVTRFKMPYRRKAASLWSLHPELHDDVARSLDEEELQLDFFEVDDEQTNIKERDTNVMGRFICQNNRCYSSGWSSNKIAITIRMYPRQRYNARLYHQRCRNCRAIGRLVLDTESYAERVTYWLKKWHGIEVERPYYSVKSKGPHDSQLCEGCKVGHCPNSNDDLALVLAG